LIRLYWHRNKYARIYHAVATDPAASARRSQHMTNPDHTGHSVLIADSDSNFRIALSRVLGQRGHAVLGASTLAEARHMLTRMENALLITDIRFPDGDGLDLLGIVKRQWNAERAPIARSIVLTSYGTLALAVAAAKLGTSDFLTKPSDVDAIETAMLGLTKMQADEKFADPNEFEFRYILTIFEQHDRNLSETSRAISMHRRTLQRVLRRHGIAPLPRMVQEPPNNLLKNERLAHLWSHLLTCDSEPRLLEIELQQ
jgi:two-component system, response regulator RegA